MYASGIIETIGPTGGVIGTRFNIAMKFGTGSVNIERYLPAHDAWVKVATVAADYDVSREYAIPVKLRLNCTAVSSAVKWEIESTAT